MRTFGVSTVTTRVTSIQRGGGSESGRTLTCGVVVLAPLGGGYETNVIDRATLDEVWGSAPRRDSQDGVRGTHATR